MPDVSHLMVIVLYQNEPSQDLLVAELSVVVLLLPLDVHLLGGVLCALAHVPRRVHVRQGVEVAGVS